MILVEKMQDFMVSSSQRVLVLFGALLGLAVSYGVAVAFYNVYLHPLRHIPGPKAAAASRIPWAGHIRNGTLVKYIKSLHENYGEVVRVAPNELSFISGETAWQDIYGHRTGKNKKGAYLKDLMFFPPPQNGVYSIIGANEADHSRQRRLLAHAFSDKALREQEPLVQKYVDLLIHRLHEQVQGEKHGKADMVRWYNYTTFDVIADLTFGDSFHCLRDKDYHPWVSMAFQAAKAFGFIAVKRFFPLWAKLENMFKGSEAAISFRRQFFGFVNKKVSERLSMQTVRPDFMSFIMRHQDDNGMTLGEIESTMAVFMVAGSETTATMLSGTTYLLLRNLDKLKMLIEEVRGTFNSQQEITIAEVNKMPYLNAVLNEGLRLYPPVPTGFPRVVPKGGDIISGYWVPENTSVYVSQHAANHSHRNFTEPDSYLPERWLGDERFANDKFAVFNPFSFGPRNCLGKNLAYIEMRLIMAKLIWNFDIELHPETQTDWLDQKLFTLWEKSPLYVKLKPVVRN